MHQFFLFFKELSIFLLLCLLVGQLPPTTSSIIIDDQHIEDNWNKAHEYFVSINQKHFIFDLSLLFNLTLGKRYSKDK